MQSIINNLLPHAIDLISKEKQLRLNQNDDNSNLDGIYESYLSQFGPMANQLGLRSTLAVYFHKRKIILKLIYNLLKKDTSINFINKEKENYEVWSKSLLQLNNNAIVEISSMNEQYILDASIALKRAIRTFPLVKNNNTND